MEYNKSGLNGIIVMHDPEKVNINPMPEEDELEFDADTLRRRRAIGSEWVADYNWHFGVGFLGNWLARIRHNLADPDEGFSDFIAHSSDANPPEKMP